MLSPQVLENLWQQTISAYIENPLSALFKEKLNAQLSRFCSSPYCMIVHSAALRPLGMKAGEVLALLGDVSLTDSEMVPGELPVPASNIASNPEADPQLESTLFRCATSVFLEHEDADLCQAEMRRLLGDDLYVHLISYLAYIKTCHTWIEANPEVSHDADVRVVENLGPLLAEEPALAEFFLNYRERVATIKRSRSEEELLKAERLRSIQVLRESEEKLRLLVDGAKDYAMILMDRIGRITGWNAGAERILGYTEEEVRHKSIHLIFTGTDRANGLPDQELERAARDGKAMDMRWHRRKDGTHFWADGTMEALFDESNTMRGFAKILRDATAQKLAEENRKRIQEQLDEHHKRTANILDSITDGFITLDNNWCYTFINSKAERMLKRSRGQLIGKCIWTEYPTTMDSIFGKEYRRAVDEQVAVFVEEYSAVLGTWMEARAYPSPEGLSVYFHDITERKEIEKEQQRLTERERKIATQLQGALQPPLPGKISGLAVTKHYEAALTHEAAVGGDFYDVFAVEKGCTAFVVGDLSGKGLQAAAQVSVVRNMLRAFLYSKPRISEALNDLNQVLAENRLLTGFCTLFVGAYDSATRQLSYVNCGQEPCLVRRAESGIVEELSATGPVMGAISGVTFEEKSITLERGDAFAIMSDGLTEVGPSRKQLLGIEGVAFLFSEATIVSQQDNCQDLAEELAENIIRGVAAAAGPAGMRDDVCLLLAVVE